MGAVLLTASKGKHSKDNSAICHLRTNFLRIHICVHAVVEHRLVASIQREPKREAVVVQQRRYTQTL